MKEKIEGFLDLVKQRNGLEPEFLQAVEEVAETVIPYIVKHDIYHGKNILLRMVEPERAVTFRVNWVDDDGEIQVNRGYRIQMNSAIGPYKGGLRFHPSVNMSILKFLAFEQVFKNSLTTLPMGGGKGGSDFDPAASYPARVFKGMKMAGRMGTDTVKVQNLRVLKVVADQNLIVVKGCVPGHKNAYVKIEK